MIESFKANPYTAGHEWLSKMIRRADKVMVERNMTKANLTKEDLVDKIEKVANNKPTINSSNKSESSSKPKTAFNSKKADEYTDKEIEEMLSQLKEE